MFLVGHHVSFTVPYFLMNSTEKHTITKWLYEQYYTNPFIVSRFISHDTLHTNKCITHSPLTMCIVT